MRAWTSDRNRKIVEKHRDKLKADGYKTRLTTNEHGVHILWVDNLATELFHGKR